MSEALETALRERSDLDQHGVAKRTLFALQLLLDLEDVSSIAATALTDGPDDKSCDLVYVDRDSGKVVIAQGYEAQSDKPAAPAGKAASLHQAVNWLFASTEESQVPQRLRSAWRELHLAIEDRVVEDIEIWFVHNLPESTAVQGEIDKAAQATYAILGGAKNGLPLNVSALELGRQALSERYEGSRTTILVSDDFSIPVQGAFRQDGDNWSAVTASIPASWLNEQFKKHKASIFSANIRGYLGSTRSQSNINNGIQDTIRRSPRRFWAYNNGITALVHKFETDDATSSINITGLAIVNGAQTTGAISTAGASNLGDARILARFIKCDDAQTVQDIIRYNNRQNPTQASDFRSNDRVQTRLVSEFGSLGVVGYNGGRRGGIEDVIRRPGEN